jgi:hypothetical protein
MKPIALLMLYSSGLIKSPCAETVSYEYKLIEKAKSKNNEVLGLESLQNQFEFLESIPSDSIINQMIRIAKGEDSNKDETALLIDAYKHQNLTALDFLINKAGAEGLIDNKVFIENRNKNWAKAMASIMTQKPTFFAVGAGHLHGLIDLLKSAGFKVEPIK